MWKALLIAIIQERIIIRQQFPAALLSQSVVEHLAAKEADVSLRS